MGVIPEQQINELKDRLDIVDIISDYVNLKRAGASFKGLCPFHSEKTPSFMVSREKNNFHCFGCHQGGDTISFIMKIENLNYIESIKFLAEKLGMSLEETAYSKDKSKKYNKYYEINSLAAKFYFKNLLTNEFPQKYLSDRGLSKKILNKYFLGYAKNDNSLYHFLKNNDIKEQDMLDLGLIGKSEDRYYDKFRDRLIFPILNNKNKVIGFGARTLINHNIKYLNSSESDVFVKGKNIYGVNVINKSRNRDKIILVEGYMDVISLYNQGIDYAVATLGTALTPDQARLVKRYGKQIYVAYDGDEAGIKATLRAIDVFKNMNVQLLIMEFPDNLDPDEYISKYGKEKFEILLKNSTEPIDFKLQKLSEKNESKLDFIKDVIEFLADIEGNVIRDIYIDKSAKFIGVSTDSLRNDVNKKIESIKYKNKFKSSHNLKNNKFGYKRSIHKNTLQSNTNNKKKSLEKEIILYSILDSEKFKTLSKVESFIEDKDLRNIYILIEEYHNKNSSIERVLESKLYLSHFSLEDYEKIKDNNPTNKIIDELIDRIYRFKLESRKEELIKLLKENKSDTNLLQEYTEILQKLT